MLVDSAYSEEINSMDMNYMYAKVHGEKDATATLSKNETEDKKHKEKGTISGSNSNSIKNNYQNYAYGGGAEKSSFGEQESKKNTVRSKV